MAWVRVRGTSPPYHSLHLIFLLPVTSTYLFLPSYQKGVAKTGKIMISPNTRRQGAKKVAGMCFGCCCFCSPQFVHCPRGLSLRPKKNRAEGRKNFREEGRKTRQALGKATLNTIRQAPKKPPCVCFGCCNLFSHSRVSYGGARGAQGGGGDLNFKHRDFTQIRSHSGLWTVGQCPRP
jgi:hypothetical protein